ncbi:M23 family metallopeptidase [Crassaminicella thermophila]|nr:M23 family metallopeptidase [Crassaminicella thermophila]
MGLKKWFSKENGIYKILDKEGFYIILFLCICIVATTAVWVSKINIDKLATEDISPPSLEDKNDMADDLDMTEYNPKKPTIVVEDIEEDETVTSISVAEQDKKKKEEILESKHKDKVEKIKTQQKSTKEEMKVPVVGKRGMDYAVDTLTYSKTLDQYTTHYGIDIIAKENTPVVAALGGEVIEVTRDSKLGITISLLHDEGMITKYANLSTDSMVKVGDRVEKGQIISGVGKTALFEILEEPHLHFEVLVDGKNVNPNNYLHMK